MERPRVLIVDFASDARAVRCGRAIALALADETEMEIVRPARGRDWAGPGLMRSSHVILSGSDIPIPRDEPWFADTCRQLRTVVEAGVPVLGVCFGHQILVQALGEVGMVRRAPVAEYGIRRMRCLPRQAHDPVLGVLPGAGFDAYSLHSDEVDAARAVPELGLEVLAESDDCPVQAYRLPGRPVWGVQFHPELTPHVVAEAVKRAPARLGRPPVPPGVPEAIERHPSCQRPELFDAFLAVPRAEAAGAGTVAAD
ncbi:MAG: gamma-glutamyl-gamma-aminobutyrate hydrolase family protein [Alphaproteobacteria bacterium]